MKQYLRQLILISLAHLQFERIYGYSLDYTHWRYFNFTNCCKKAQVYVYSIDLRNRSSISWKNQVSIPFWSLNTRCYFAPFGSLNMLNHEIINWSKEDGAGFLTEDPAKACILIVPAIPNGCAASRDRIRESVWAGEPVPAADVKRQLVAKWLRRLPHWKSLGDDGNNHLILDYYDIGDEGPWRSSGRYISSDGTIEWNRSFPFASMDTGHAIVAGSSLDRRSIRLGFDISIFLSHSYPVIPSSNNSSNKSSGMMNIAVGQNEDRIARNHPSSNRPHMACFFGKVYGHCCNIRKDIKDLAAKVSDSKILAVDDIEKHVGMSYATKLSQCIFGIVPRGKGYHSFRLLEVMAAGAIPVIFNDFGALPFEDIWDWNQFSVIFSEKELWRMIPELNRIKDDSLKLSQMQQNVISLYETHLNTKQKLWTLLFNSLKERILRPIRKHNIC